MTDDQVLTTAAAITVGALICYAGDDPAEGDRVISRALAVGAVVLIVEALAITRFLMPHLLTLWTHGTPPRRSRRPPRGLMAGRRRLLAAEVALPRLQEMPRHREEARVARVHLAVLPGRARVASLRRLLRRRETGAAEGVGVALIHPIVVLPIVATGYIDVGNGRREAGVFLPLGYGLGRLLSAQGGRAPTFSTGARLHYRVDILHTM